MTIVALGFGRVALSNFIVRGVADRRLALPREWLLAAAERFPNSARINFQLANTEIAGGVGIAQYDTQAENHALRAVNLSPWNYQAHRLLATAQEFNGKQAEAEKSLRRAVKLAPNNSELNWEFANLLARRGKLEESFAPFRLAARSQADLQLSTIETIWRASGEKIETLKAFAANDAELSLSVVKFLIEQNLTAEAVSVFSSMDKAAKARSPQSRELINTLLRAGQLNLAKSTWLELMSASNAERTGAERTGAERTGAERTGAGTIKVSDDQASKDLDWSAPLWNGGFETDAVDGLNHFDWVIRENKFARIAIDRNFARTGSRSLKIVFLGIDTTTLRDQVQQTMILRPGVAYRLECRAKTKDLVTPEGPRIAVFGPAGALGQSEPVKADASEWQRLVVDFITPANTASVTLSIVRTPRFSYDDPTRGIIWFDDFTLVER